MKKAAALALLLTSCGTNVPARYDHPYKGTLHVGYANSVIVQKVCRSISAAACKFNQSKHDCWVLINEKYKTNEGLFRHEQAHCNGWSRRHEQ